MKQNKSKITCIYNLHIIIIHTLDDTVSSSSENWNHRNKSRWKYSAGSYERNEHNWWDRINKKSAQKLTVMQPRTFFSPFRILSNKVGSSLVLTFTNSVFSVHLFRPDGACRSSCFECSFLPTFASRKRGSIFSKQFAQSMWTRIF